MTALIRFMDWPLRAKMAAVFVLASILPSVISTLVNTPDVRQQFVWAGVSILMVLVFGICFAAVILKPVGSLSKGIELIAGGDLGARVHLDHTDELGLLCARFNFMAERIEVQAHALKTAREELAARVQERTMELVQTAKDLQVETSDRNRAQETVRKSEAQLQTIVESLDEGVAVFHLNGQVLHFNRAALEMHGYASLDECRRNLAEFAETFELTGADGAIWPEDQWPLARILRGERLRDVEARIRRVQTDWHRVFSYGGTLVHDAAGHSILAVVTISDITERQRAELAAVLLAAVVESSSDAVIGKDLKGIVTSWNAAAQRIFGYSADEILGRPITLIIPPNHHQDEEQLLLQRVEHFETERLRKDGTRVAVSITVTPIKDAHGEVIGVTKVVRDITEQQRAAEMIRQLNIDLEERVVERTAQLQTANKELEAFSYSVSHDLRAPLRSLDGFSQALMEDCADKLDAESLDNLRRIRSASQRMGQLIDDLLNLSRLTRGELTRQTVDLSKIAQETADELRASDTRREVNFVIPGGLIAEVDPRLLQIVLTNLLGNAWKFTANRLDALIEFGSDGEDGSKAFFVRDNGVGFDMAYAGKLFGAFQRLHAMHDFPGTGIGLVTVQRIIHRHGGRIWAESAVNAGATFHFTLRTIGEQEGTYARQSHLIG
jgi:PAS domain S-box-containing protein